MSAENQHIDLHELIAKQLSGEISAQEQRQLNVLLLEEENKKIVEDTTKIWEAAPSSSIEFDAQAALSKLNNRIIENQINNTSSKRLPLTWLVAVAASVVVFVSVLFFMTNKTENTIATVSIQTEHLTEVQRVPIADGTQVAIDLKSTLEYPQLFADKTREVRLEGKAFFDVAHNKKKPFIIHTEHVDIQVLGTSFYTHAENGSLETSVSVVTGQVKMTDIDHANNFIILEKGKKGVFNSQTKKFSIVATNPNDYFWNTKTLTFRSATIAEVVKTVNKSYGTDITVRGALATQAIETTFENNTPQEIIDMIQALTGCSITHKGEKTILE